MVFAEDLCQRLFCILLAIAAVQIPVDTDRCGAAAADAIMQHSVAPTWSVWLCERSNISKAECLLETRHQSDNLFFLCICVAMNLQLVPVIDAPKASRRGRPPAGAFSMEDYDDSADLLPTPTAAAPVLPPPVEIDPAVLQATALKEKKIWMLLGVRFELETLRMLADQVKRREKIKVQVSCTFT